MVASVSVKRFSNTTTLYQERKIMKSLFNLAGRFLADEKAAEVTELGIVLALIVAAAVALIKGIGLTVTNAYNAVNANL